MNSRCVKMLVLVLALLLSQGAELASTVLAAPQNPASMIGAYYKSDCGCCCSEACGAVCCCDPDGGILPGVLLWSSCAPQSRSTIALDGTGNAWALPRPFQRVACFEHGDKFDSDCFSPGPCASLLPEEKVPISL